VLGIRWKLRAGMLLSALVLSQPTAASDDARIVTIDRADGAQTRVRIDGPSGKCPQTAIFSHGLGGGIGGTSILLAGLAQSGWRVMAMEHVESGPAALAGLRAAPVPGEYFRARAGDPHRHEARFADLEAVFLEATRSCRPPQLLLIGHSMGATTAMLEAGAKARFGRMGHDRFDAYVALSPRGAGMLFSADAWADIEKPMLMVTGPKDASVEGDWTTRLSAFEGLPKGRKRLAIVPDADHMDMGGYTQVIGTKVTTLISEFARALLLERRLLESGVAGVQIRDK
jgi:pimeloyl-ACP methyl ester carboxylesterase